MLQMLPEQELDSRDRQTGTESRAQGQRKLSMFINFCSFSPAGPGLLPGRAVDLNRLWIPAHCFDAHRNALREGGK